LISAVPVRSGEAARKSPSGTALAAAVREELENTDQAEVTCMDDDASKPFILLGRKGQANSVQLKYGERPDDPAPFILIVTPTYVADKLGKESSTYKEVVAYVDTHLDELKAVAIHQHGRGFATEVLS
jgi:hypothetical protein